MDRQPLIVRPLCAACNGPVYHAAKSHRHYTHRTSTGCSIRRVESITMQTVTYRED